MVLEFELVTVCAEVGHAHSVARRICRRITHYQVDVGAESCAEGLGREADEKKKRAFQAFKGPIYKAAALRPTASLLDEFRAPCDYQELK